MLVLVCGLVGLSVQAQDSLYAKELHDDTLEMQQNVKRFNEAINERLAFHTANQFTLFKEQRIQMLNGSNQMVAMKLESGNWYHFVFVADPSCKKFKVNLFKEGQGDLVTDRTGKRFNEFVTEFSFMCPVTGIYEFNCQQKGKQQRPLAYLMLFKRDKDLRPTEKE